jgi:hypothetical protein
VFKIFPKVPSIRFDLVLNKVILPCQNAFIKTRGIIDGICYLHEIIHESKCKKQQGVVFKIDFEKAYDKVSWDFFIPLYAKIWF